MYVCMNVCVALKLWICTMLELKSLSNHTTGIVILQTGSIVKPSQYVSQEFSCIKKDWSLVNIRCGNASKSKNSALCQDWQKERPKRGPHY